MEAGKNPFSTVLNIIQKKTIDPIEHNLVQLKGGPSATATL